MKKYKSVISILLTLSLFFCLSTTCFASETSVPICNSEINLSVDELNEGVDLSVVSFDDGSISIIKSNELRNNINLLSDTEIEATFHVGLTRVQTSKGILYWKATMYQIKNVTGTIYCKNASFLSFDEYCSSNIICPRLDGTTNIAQNSTPTFTIPSSTTTFKVGFSNLYLSSITKTISFGSGSSNTTK